MALAAKLSTTPKRYVVATSVMPSNTPLVKKRAIVQDFGAAIVTVVHTNESPEAEAERIRSATNATFVHPHKDPRVFNRHNVMNSFLSTWTAALRSSGGG
jgi:threonine dehydratase